MASRTAGMSVRTELAVSTWQTSTARISPALSAASRSRRRWGSTAAKGSASIRSTCTPIASAVFAQELPKCPDTSTSARSPGANRFMFAASQAAWPLPI